MKISRWIGVSMVAGALVAGACTAEVEDEGALPDVEVQGGDMPNVDVDPANVDIGVSSDTQTVVTPDVDVDVSAPK
ncbi:MAG: hypothetical protein KY464_16635 [Gemmatimonadetes bacterium]|nr:hypothetical protein [Gemmatimonadota bacterium]